MTSLSSQSDPVTQPRRFRMSPALGWVAGLLLAALAISVADHFTGNLVPRWLRFGLIFLPPALCLASGVVLLFNLGRCLVAADGSSRKRTELVLIALQMGSRRWGAAFIALLSVALSLGPLEMIPTDLRAVLAALPLIPLVMLLRSIGREDPPVDELAALIRREAYGFVFKSVIVVLFSVHLLSYARILPTFTWKAIHLVVLMYGLFITGLVLASRRFR